MTGALGRSDDLTIEAIWRCRCVAPTKRLGEPEDRAPPSRHGFSCSVHRKTDPGSGHPLPLFLAGARCMLASAHDGAVDHQPFKIGFTRQRQQHRVENARLNPAIITPLYRAIVAEPFRQIAPTPARARHPQKRIQKLSVVGGGPRLPWVPPGTNPLIRSHWSSRSASQSIADPKNQPDDVNAPAQSGSRYAAGWSTERKGSVCNDDHDDWVRSGTIIPPASSKRKCTA